MKPKQHKLIKTETITVENVELVVQTKIIVFAVGKENVFGHASKEVIEIKKR